MCRIFIPIGILHHLEHFMTHAFTTDYLIIGQGLAGTLLSYQMHKAGIKHLVVDHVQEGAASRAAAGLINPIVIKRMVKTWQADVFFPFAVNTYRELEVFLKMPCFHPKPILKLLGSEDPVFWQHQIAKHDLSAYASLSAATDVWPPLIKAPFGVGLITQAARLDMTTLLNAYRLFLKNEGLLVDAVFRDEDLVVDQQAVAWKGIRARKVIFCRGAWDAGSSFFQHLKFRNTKGELLDVEIPRWKSDHLVSRGVFVMPVGNGHFKIGATYAHHWEDLSPSAEKKAELLSKWSAISDAALVIKRQITGIRPTLADRRPVIGFLKQYPQVGLFNGLGSRGGLMAPYLAREWVRLLQDENYQTFAEVGLERHK